MKEYTQCYREIHFVLNLYEPASQGLLEIMSRQWVGILLRGLGVGYSTTALT